MRANVITRRDVLKKSALELDAFAVNGSPSTISAQSSENDTIGVAVIGTRTRELRTALQAVKSMGNNNNATLDRTIRHLTKNGVDLKTHPMTMGPLLKFDPAGEVFSESAEANAMLSCEHRDGFVCPTADHV